MKRVLIPFVEKNYRTVNNANSRAFVELSLGWFTYTLLCMFFHLGVFSSGWIIPMLSKNRRYTILFNKTAICVLIPAFEFNGIVPCVAITLSLYFYGSIRFHKQTFSI